MNKSQHQTEDGIQTLDTIDPNTYPGINVEDLKVPFPINGPSG